MSPFRALALLVLLGLPAHGESLLNPVFQDHAVLQRDAPVRLWGTATPGVTLTVSLGAATANATADSAGRWHAELAPFAAGGPYALAVKTSTGASQTLSDILMGDVYLCSGQSNMAFPVSGANDSWTDIQHSANDTIRLLNIPNSAKAAPQSALSAPAVWAAASPKSVPEFSAVCYFFARSLQKSQHVPLGLISASWSGANITSFMSAAALRQAGGHEKRLEALKLYASDPAAGLAHWGHRIEAYWQQRLGEAPWADPALSSGWAEAPKELGVWTGWGVPSLADFTGHIWFRTSVTLTAAQAAQKAELALGTLTDEDQTWVNGHFIADTWAFVQDRTYALPADVLHEGANDILINVQCVWKMCGLSGAPSARALRLADGSAVPLAGPWRYNQVPDTAGPAPQLPWGPLLGVTVAYNGMIAPLAPYGLRGVLWYQGEGNSSDPASYPGLLKAFLAGWRTTFAAPKLPFLIVQLADLGQPPFAPENSNWAQIRETQRRIAEDDPNAALAVTIDIGDRMGIHFTNKQEVGRRLALAAGRLIYGDQTLKPGPQPVRAERKGRIVTVTFDGINGKLAAVSAQSPIGFELCDATCRFAAAEIAGDTVKLSLAKGVNPTRVRYCWANSPVCTLYDSSLLPAVPFEIAVSRREH